MCILKSLNWATVPTLIRLRHQLFWAQARTSNGKWALLASLYVVGISIFLFLTLSGFGAAVAAIRFGRGGQISLWILTGIFFNGLIIGLISGIGPRRAFSESVLRRYPMTATDRLVSRHVTGFLEPGWPLVSALVLGLAVGFANTNPLRILVGLPVAVLFALICYLSAVTALATIGRLLQHRAGAAALGAIFVLPRRRAEELIDVMDLKVALVRPLAQYSAGMRQKVAFAAAIIHNPEILFLDEPFANIDPAAAAMIKDWLRRYTAQGRTVFMTSHVLETVERLCDDVAIIHGGKLAWRGEMKELGSGGTIEFEGRRFGTLEALFLHIVGEQHRGLTWL